MAAPRFPESPPKNPATNATLTSTVARWRIGNRGCHPASWLTANSETVTPRIAKSARSGSTSTSCAESAIVVTRTRFSRQKVRRLIQAAPTPFRKV